MYYFLQQGEEQLHERHNKEVRQIRDMLKNITDAMLYLAKQELAFRGHDEFSDNLIQGNYRELNLIWIFQLAKCCSS